MKNHEVEVSTIHTLLVAYDPHSKRWVGNVFAKNGGTVLYETVTAETKEQCLVFTAMQYEKEWGE